MFPRLNLQPRAQVHTTPKAPQLTIDDFWEEIAEGSISQRLEMLTRLLQPHSMHEFTVASETFFHIRSLLEEDNDYLYSSDPSAYTLAFTLCLALGDCHVAHLSPVISLLQILESYPRTRRLLVKHGAVRSIQRRLSKISDDDAIVCSLQDLMASLMNG